MCLAFGISDGTDQCADRPRLRLCGKSVNAARGAKHFPLRRFIRRPTDSRPRRPETTSGAVCRVRLSPDSQEEP